jgi:hypothetical protein
MLKKLTKEFGEKLVSVENASFDYWRWFFRGSGGRPGFRRVVNAWLILHISIGIFLAVVVRVDVPTSANAVLLPLAGILVGLSFAWAGNAQALMQTSEIEELSTFHPGGFAEYVYAYQTAILAILITLVFWGLAGLHVFDLVWPTAVQPKLYFVIKAFLFTLCSLTLRECWHVVMAAQLMLIVRREMRAQTKRKTTDVQ